MALLLNKLKVPSTFHRGISPGYWFRNGIDATSTGAQRVAAYINMLGGKRKKVLFRRSLQVTDSTGTAGTSTAFFCSFHTSPNVSKIGVVTVLLPADNTGAALDPYVVWTTTTDATFVGSLNPHETIYSGKRLTTTPGANDLSYVTEIWEDLEPSTTYYARMTKNDYARVLSVTIFEIPQNAIDYDPIDPANDAAANVSGFHPRGSIYAAHIDDLQDTLDDYWKHGSPNILNWGRHEAAAALTTSSTTYVNVWDASFADWSAGAPGAWCAPRHKGTYNSTNVPIRLRVYGDVSGAGPETGTVVFRTSAGSTMATIDVGTTVQHYTATGNLNSTHTTDKIDVLFRVDDAADTMTISGITIEEYET